MNNSKPEKTIQLFLSLVRDTFPHSFSAPSTPLPHQRADTHCALWLQSGLISVNDKPLATGQGVYLSPTDTVEPTGNVPAVSLRFIVSLEPLSTAKKPTSSKSTCDIITTQAVNAPIGEMLLRLDQVDFPPAAVAYKHTHPGPGIRYLVEGGLTLQSEHNEQIINAGTAWFEDANSPVTATANNKGTSRFVRTMLLPLEYEDRSTFTFYNKADTDKPKLQTNIRHFEKRIVITKHH